jgi:hypothetical protein
MNVQPQELGPKQKLVVEALRSGKYIQGRNRLCTDDGRYCCLGVMNEVLSLGEKNEYCLTNTYEEIGLYDEEGLFTKCIDGWESLICVNDDGVSFEDIANYMEKYPSLIFTRSV